MEGWLRWLAAMAAPTSKGMTPRPPGAQMLAQNLQTWRQLQQLMQQFVGEFLLCHLLPQSHSQLLLGSCHSVDCAPYSHKEPVGMFLPC